MRTIHIKNLEKFHPGYKDRELHYAKVYFRLVQGDPEFEMIADETDKWRFVAMVCLELAAKKPLPDEDAYWKSKGFNVKKRPMSLTLQSLHNFVSIATEERGIDISRVEDIQQKSREEQRRSVTEPGSERIPMEQDFEVLWRNYPVREGKKAALRHFLATVKTLRDLDRIAGALAKYLESYRVKRGYIKNGSTWFNQWEDWDNPTDAMMKGQREEPAHERPRKAGGATTVDDVKRRIEIDEARRRP